MSDSDGEGTVFDAPFTILFKAYFCFLENRRAKMSDTPLYLNQLILDPTLNVEG